MTYEQAQPPYKIGVTKSWNAINSCWCIIYPLTHLSFNAYYLTGSLNDPLRQPKDIVIEDQFIRKFVLGTWYKVWLSEVVIKRRHNDLIVCGIVCPLPSMSSIYFLTGYTEELLSHLLKHNVRMEIQCVPSKKNVIHKHI